MLISKKEHDFIDDFYNGFFDNRKIILFGGGDVCSDVLDVFFTRGIQADFICDNDPLKHGTMINNVLIISFQELLNLNEPIVVILTVNSPIVKNELFGLLEKEESKLDAYVYFQYPSLDFSNGIPFYDSNDNCFVVNFHIKSMQWYFNSVYKKVRNFNVKYFEKVITFPPLTTAEGRVFYLDYESEFTNIRNKQRLVTNSPEVGDVNIFCVGASKTYGIGLEDAHTYPSILQDLFNKTFPEKNAKVHNFSACHGGDNFTHETVLSLPLKQGDVVVRDVIGSVRTIKKFTEMTYDNIQMAKFFAFMLDKEKEYCLSHGARYEPIILRNVDVIKKPSCVGMYLQNLRPRYNDKIQAILTSLMTKFNLDFLAKICSEIGLVIHDTYNDLQTDNYGELFIDKAHYSYNGTNLIANKLFEILTFRDSFLNEFNEYSQKYEIMRKYKRITANCWNSKPFLDEAIRLHEISKDKPENAGAVVVNCNPFSLGHRYLIETAAKQVPILYVLVLREDKSEFTFKDRIEMVREGTADLKNVMVLDGGNRVITNDTFPEYFNKKDIQGEKIDATRDITIFGEVVAPLLKVTKRFAGSEPECNITSQYNQQMSGLLPGMGIEFKEIKRLEKGGEVISASRVRKLINEGRIGEISSIVPETTYEYIKNKL